MAWLVPTTNTGDMSKQYANQSQWHQTSYLIVYSTVPCLQCKGVSGKSNAKSTKEYTNGESNPDPSLNSYTWVMEGEDPNHWTIRVRLFYIRRQYFGSYIGFCRNIGWNLSSWLLDSSQRQRKSGAGKGVAHEHESINKPQQLPLVCHNSAVSNQE